MCDVRLVPYRLSFLVPIIFSLFLLVCCAGTARVTAESVVCVSARASSTGRSGEGFLMGLSELADGWIGAGGIGARHSCVAVCGPPPSALLPGDINHRPGKFKMRPDSQNTPPAHSSETFGLGAPSAHWVGVVTYFSGASLSGEEPDWP